jgi:diguanylate cyclase (GGDEF)-like protein
MFIANNLSILLVDNNVDLLKHWSTTLEKSFKAVHLAGHAYAGLETLHRQSIDIVLAGKQLPEMDGFGFCRELKRQGCFSSVPVGLYKPGSVTLEDKYLAAKSGAELIISQPASADDLVKTIINTYTGGHSKPLLGSPKGLGENGGRSEGYADFLTQKLGDTINQLKKEQQSLNTALTRFQDFAYSVGNYFWETDTEMRLTFLGCGPDNTFVLPTRQYEKSSFSEFFKGYIHKEGLSKFVELAAQEQPLDISSELKGGDTQCWVKIIGNPYHAGAKGFSGYRGLIVDVGDPNLGLDRQHTVNHHDGLTGLLSAQAFNSMLGDAIKSLPKNKEHVLCYLDLDYFRELDNLVGQHAVDELLKQITDLLREKVRANDVLARVDRNEFSILLRHCSLDQARRLVQDLHSSSKTFRFFWDERYFEVGLSIGLLEISNANVPVDAVMGLAKQMCQIAKKQGRNQIHVYGEKASAGKMTDDAHWLDRFHSAVKNDELCLFQQPIRRQRLDSGAYVNAYEVLVRMRDDERLIAPKYFLSVVDQYQLTNILDRWVFNRVFEWLDSDDGKNAQGEFYSVNLSSVSFSDPKFRQYVLTRLKSNKQVAKKLCFEITESTAMEDFANAIEFISSIRALGCRFALDDFGTGFSSLAHLKSLPVDFLKLDGMFIQGVSVDPVDYGLVESIQKIAGIMNMQTIAEYVESEEIEATLTRIGIDYLQGFHIGYPEMIPISSQVGGVTRIHESLYS